MCSAWLSFAMASAASSASSSDGDEEPPASCPACDEGKYDGAIFQSDDCPGASELCVGDLCFRCSTEEDGPDRSADADEGTACCGDRDHASSGYCVAEERTSLPPSFYLPYCSECALQPAESTEDGGAKAMAEGTGGSKRKRKDDNSAQDLGGGGGGGGTPGMGHGAPLGPDGGTLTGAAAVEKVFHFLGSPAEVLDASTACRRWRTLACADSVWRARFEREKLLEKARAFEVALPPVPGGQGRTAAAAAQDDLGGVGLAFYARVFTLKVVRGNVRVAYYATRAPRHACLSPASLAFATATAVAVQGYQMRDEPSRMARDYPDHDGGIRTAVSAWCANPAAAKAKYGPIASWDVSKVTDLSYLFFRQAAFNEDISRWEVGQVKSTNSMLNCATSFSGDVSRWQVGRVKSMVSMFEGATSFNGDLSRWQVGQVKSMAFMFNQATSFNGDISRWEVGQVKSFTYMFYGASSFTRQLGGSWSMLNHATSTADQRGMFSGGCPGSIA